MLSGNPMRSLSQLSNEHSDDTASNVTPDGPANNSATAQNGGKRKAETALEDTDSEEQENEFDVASSTPNKTKSKVASSTPNKTKSKENKSNVASSTKKNEHTPKSKPIKKAESVGCDKMKLILDQAVLSLRLSR